MRSGIIRNHCQFKHVRMLSVLLIAVVLVVPFQSSFAAATTTTAQVVNTEQGNQTNPRVDRYLASDTAKKKRDWKWESKEAIQ